MSQSGRELSCSYCPESGEITTFLLVFSASGTFRSTVCQTDFRNVVALLWLSRAQRCRYFFQMVVAVVDGPVKKIRIQQERQDQSNQSGGQRQPGELLVQGGEAD